LLLAAGDAQARDWVVDLGIGASVRPPYEGADDVRVQPSPTLRVRRAERANRFTPPDPGASVDLIDTRYVTLGPVINLRRRRKAEGDLIGLREVKPAVEAGVFVELWPTDWLRTRFEARRGVAGHHGWVGDVGLDVIYNGDRWDVSAGPRVGFGEANYLDTYFGVTAAEAAANPLIDRAYSPTRGRRYTGLQTAFSYRLSDHWRTASHFGYRRLADRAVRSPIVRTSGSGNYFTGGAGLIYSFGFSR
jgi:outer membrane protein